MNAPLRTTPAPIGLLAELTHRCPLRCPYCSNPLELERRVGGARHARPGSACSARPPRSASCMCTSPAASRRRGPISSSSRPIAPRDGPLHQPHHLRRRRTPATRSTPWRRPGSTMCSSRSRRPRPARPTASAAAAGGHDQKLGLRRAGRALGLPLTVNAVIHRANIERCRGFIDLAVEHGRASASKSRTRSITAGRYVNRAALMPTRAEVDCVDRRRRGGAQAPRRAGSSSTSSCPTTTPLSEGLHGRLGTRAP